MHASLPYALLLMAGLVIITLALIILRMRTHLHALREQTKNQQSQRETILRTEAIAAERERIYRDLHDDIGAKLLGLIHSAHTPLQADTARAILQDLRDVVTRSRGTPGTLADVLADIRSEATQRLATVGIGLSWEEIDDLPTPSLDTERALHLHRIVREAISNTIRHAQAQHLRVRLRCHDNQLGIELTDDGHGVPQVASHPGNGIRSMRTRATELDGDIHWTPGTEGGTKILLSMPLTTCTGTTERTGNHAA